MRHIGDGALRRLVDDPSAVSDGQIHHVSRCERCRRRSRSVGYDAHFAARTIGVQVGHSDPEFALARVKRHSGTTSVPVVPKRAGPHLSWRVMGMSFGSAASIVATATVVAGVAAAASFTTVFAPTKVAPVRVSAAEVESVANVIGIGDESTLGGFDRPSGTKTFAFGTVRWSSDGMAQTVDSIVAAETATGLSVSIPSKLPQGVGAPFAFLVVPKVSVSVTFGPQVGAMDGKSLLITLGPAVAVEYEGGATGGYEISPLVTVTMARPVATSDGPSTTQLERLLFTEPGISPELARDMKLFGDLSTTLPVPAPPGTSSESIVIDGNPGVLLTTESGIASGAVWEDRSDVVHVVVGLLDQKDVLNVAQQIG